MNDIEEFAKDKKDNKTDLIVVYKTNINTSKIADIDYELSQKLIKKYDLFDFREMIEILKEKGYNGWKTTGSLGYDKYDDYLRETNKSYYDCSQICFG